MKNKIISRKIIKEEFSFLSRAEYCGVKGVIRIDSGRPGPTLGLTICTHGNEVAGLSAVNYLRGKYNIAKKLIRGSLVITLNNLKATGRALEAKDEMSRLKSRYIDLNFNRLPKNLRKIRRDNRYEINRAKDLLPIWAMFDVALDIHSTIQDNPPMIVASDNLDYRLIRGFPIKTVISNIVKVQIGAPAFSFYGSGRHIQTVEIESGQHDRASSQAVAVKCILSLLKSLGMIRGGNMAEEKVFDEYFIDGSIIFPDRQASLARAFKDFEFIRKGESLATVHGRVIKARKDCCIIMAPKGLKPARVGEEAVFLSRPVNKKII